jgi:hypothetical protein
VPQPPRCLASKRQETCLASLPLPRCHLFFASSMLSWPGCPLRDDLTCVFLLRSSLHVRHFSPLAAATPCTLSRVMQAETLLARISFKRGARQPT